jgi:hypothetical protein
MTKQIQGRLATLLCSVCSKAHEAGAHLPRGWKNHREQIYCEKCWSERYVLRAIVMPVVSPIDVTWQELNDLLNRLFQATTMVSNWMVAELAKRDIRRHPGEPKMPRMPHIYLYPEARSQFPELPPQSVASLERAVQRKYRSKRYEVIWRCAAALPTYRYPQPFPVHNQSWSPAIVEETPRVTVRIGEGRRLVLRLKGGWRYRRQLAAFRSMCSGEAKYGELALYRSGADLLCKMVCWRARPEEQQRSGVLYVHTTADALLIALSSEDKTLWRYNADHIRRWAAEHRKQLQRWAEDSKAEQRPVPDFAERRQANVTKYKHRMSAAAYQAAAYLAAYAARRKFAVVEYNDLEHAYCPDFVWSQLGDRIAMMLDEYGVEFRVSARTNNKTEESLAEEKKQ